MNAVNQYISSDLLEKKGEPNQGSLDALADVISIIEYYLEAVLEGRSSTSDILMLAHVALEKLGYTIEVPAETLPPTLSPTLSQEKFEPETPQPLNHAEEEVAKSPVPDESALDVPESQNELDDDDIDDEILEIFVEEAEEELGVINEVLPAWRSDFEDHEALSRIRRAFHTMKGSGRMVGADTIGELSWSAENLLNRILDNTVSASEENSALIQEVVDIMPGLVNQLKGEAGPAQDVIQALIDRATNLANPAPVDTGKEIIDQAATQEDQPDMVAEETLSQSLIEEAVEETGEGKAEEEVKASDLGSDAMDPTLHDIFIKESAGHLEEIHSFIDRCESNQEQCVITDTLVRALHTIHGSARMAGATNIAEIGGLLEKYIKALMGNNTLLPENGFVVLVEGIEAIEGMLGKINQPDSESIDYSDLQGKINALYSDELQEQEKRAGQEREAALHDQVDEVVDSEDDDEILEVFLEEGAELLDSSEMILQRWGEDIQNQDSAVELLRDIHTLKGGARMAGITAIGDLSHKMESLLTAIVDGERNATDGVIDALHRTLDSLLGMLQRTQEKQSIEPSTALMEELELLRQGKNPAAGKGIKKKEKKPPEIETAKAESAEVTAEVEADESAETIEEEYAPEIMIELPLPTRSIEPAKVGSVWEGKEDKTPHEVVRVRADLLDNMVNYAGEVSIYRSRLEQQVGAFGYNLVELDQTVLRLKEQLRKLEIETEAQILFRYEEAGKQDENFDPLELDRYSHIQQLSRSLMESTSDIASIQGLLDNLVRESETLLLQQSRVNTDLQEGLMRTRMVSFSGLVPRLQRIIRQTSQELGKKAKLDIVGEQGEMDRSVLERVTAPLEHMLRNAISHGIESPDERKKRGKPETGNINLSISREASDIVIVVSDDGGGIDLEAIRKKAIASGLMGKTSDLSDQEVMQFMLESGFSTAEEVTQISGRGVGMDVVNNEIKQLGGSLHIDSDFKQGAAFTIRLPFTLAINHALLVNISDETYAVPLTSVEGIVRLTKRELDHFYSDEYASYPYAGHEYQVRNLSSMLGFGSIRNFTESEQKVYPVLLVRMGNHRTALQVDGLMGSREIVVKSVGPQISTLRGVSGATILGDGSVVLILDVNSIIRLGESIKAGEIAQELVIAEQVDEQINVMVVDDSITVRKVTTRLLERHDIKVSTARDGVDAVAALQDHIPDVMLLDIEMPRMDGFELATYMRNEERLKNIPIIMITSRTGDKHRRRAEEIGVNCYLGKPFQESDLLENIERLVQESNVDS
jgi:chemosensory pili system protein ChpA (sensor histidine kinase/response regulator)